MENLTALNWLLTIGLAVGGWALKEYTDNQAQKVKHLEELFEALQNDLTAVRLDYLHKSDFKEFKDELWARFDKLETFLRSNNV